MDNMEFNKIFAALLIAGIVASLSGFVSHKLIHPHDLHENAYKIDAAEDTSAGVAAGPAGPEPILALLATADVGRGEQIAKACAACHSFNKGGANGIGPNLWNIVNADKARLSSFAYSEALASMEGVWSYDSLNQFLWRPKSYVAGTKMNYVGLKKPEDRAAVIAWLRTLSDSPADLPSQSQINTESTDEEPAAE
jgi:cytochrome c